MKLIGITGLARAGKDTTADYLVANHNFAKISFASPIKQAVAAMLNTSVETLEKNKEEILHQVGYSPRHLMQTLGTDWARNTLDEEFWLRLTRNAIIDIDIFYAGDINVVIPDVRFDNEAEMILDLGGSIWQVRRPNNPKVVRQHASENGVHPDLVTNCLVNLENNFEFLYDQANRWLMEVHHAKIDTIQL